MKELKVTGLERLLSSLLLLLALLSIFIVSFIFISRIAYPYSVERMEGASLLQVIRILSGHPLYTQPSIDYIPLIYPPLYFYLSALAAKIMGIGFMPLRLVSILAFIGCLLFTYRIIKSVTNNDYASLIGISFFAATYPLNGAWFDIARVDTLFVFFSIAAIYFSSKENLKGLILSSAFWILAIFTKQTGIFVLTASLVYLLLKNWKKNFIQLAITLLGGTLVYALCVQVWGKWFSYFMFYLPTLHKTQSSFADISTSIFQLVLPPIIAILIGISPFLFDRDWRSSQNPIHYYVFITCVMFGLSLMGRLNLGGYTNVYMPAHIMTAVMFGLGLDWWTKKLAPSPRLFSSLSKLVLFTFCAAQFLILQFDPRLVIPNSSQAQSWTQFVSFIRSTQGDVLAPDLNYLIEFAGKNPFANEVALEEIYGEFGDPELVQREVVRKEISRGLQDQRFHYIFLKKKSGTWNQVTDYYQCFPISKIVDSTNLPPVVAKDFMVCFPGATHN